MEVNGDVGVKGKGKVANAPGGKVKTPFFGLGERLKSKGEWYVL